MTTALPSEEEEDWDAPEAQTDPGNGLTWDEMIPRDHGVAQTGWSSRNRHGGNAAYRGDATQRAASGRGTPALDGGSARNGPTHRSRRGTAS